MTNLIIGHRGFVGSNLSRQFKNVIGVGRQQIKALAGCSFGDIYCAAPQAQKWWANQNPEQDRLEVDILINDIKRLACTRHFILFSTVDVYDPPLAVDELCKPSEMSHPYGRHRFILEQEVLDFFGSNARVIRLPALVGHGLKKNVIYDLLNNNNVDQINPNSAFQWFNLDRLPSVIDLAKRLGDGDILNVVSEPVSTASVLDKWFADTKELLNWKMPPIVYDVRTVHGSDGMPYLYSAADSLLLHLKPFIETMKSLP